MNRNLVNYFPITLVKTADLDPERSYLMGYHPHGVLSYGAFGCFATHFAKFRELFPGLSSRLIVLRAQVISEILYF